MGMNSIDDNCYVLIEGVQLIQHKQQKQNTTNIFKYTHTWSHRRYPLLPPLASHLSRWNLAILACAEGKEHLQFEIDEIRVGRWRDLHKVAQHKSLYIYISYIYIPGTQMTLFLLEKTLFWGGWPSKIEVIGVPGKYCLNLQFLPP